MQLPQHLAMINIQSAATPGKVTKVGAGYVHRPHTDYRCIDCWKFNAAKQRCAEFGPSDVVRAKGTCINWSFGNATVGLASAKAYTPKELGYTEDPNGTKCSRCKFFDKTGYCQKVDEKSPGDDTGKIDPDACCANQTPMARK